MFVASDVVVDDFATGKYLMCVCHCEDSWKNLTPCHSSPSMYTENNKSEQVNINLFGSNNLFRID